MALLSLELYGHTPFVYTPRRLAAFLAHGAYGFLRRALLP
jgi:hypothetical protein